VLIGDGPEKQKLVTRAANRCSRRIRFLDPRSHAEMPDLLAAADLVVVPLRSYIPGAVPSKLYEAMASGRPVVLMAQGEAARTVRESGAGVVVAPGDVGGLASALQTLAADAGLRWRLGAAGRVAAERQFDRARIAESFIEYLERQQVDRCHPVGGFLEQR
jgi:glycosyltransferase involved in cell wall biosynthesis